MIKKLGFLLSFFNKKFLILCVKVLILSIDLTASMNLTNQKEPFYHRQLHYVWGFDLLRLLTVCT